MAWGISVRPAAITRVAVLVSAVVVLSGCAAATHRDPAAHSSKTTPAVPSTVPAGSAYAVTVPPVAGRFDYQIGGAYPPAHSVTIVDRDRGAAAVPGKYNICYVNAFQTQAGEDAFWKAEHPDLLLRTVSGGGFVGDPDWPGEIILDTATTAKRAAIATVVGSWIADCAARHFQAVELDNLDSWVRSKGAMTQADNVAMAILLTARAHAAGLAAGQKNTAELGRTGKDVARFDFAVAEECQQYDECDAYTDVYGRDVIEIEYTDHEHSVFTRACALRGGRISVILRDREVVPRGQRGYHYESC